MVRVCRAAAIASRLVVLMVLFVPASLRAQEARGRITGRVLDASQAAIRGATVKVIDAARGTTAASTTNEEGLFQANYLLSGTYQVVVELAGFKKYVRDGVLLQISESRDLAIVLEVGGAQETVTVSADSAAMNTADANLGLTVDQRRLADLPLVHGDPYKIMGLAPGLAHTGSQRLDRPFEPTHIVGYAVDGTRGNRSDLLIDGAPSTSTANANEVIASYVPPSDIVQEFKVQTATFDAQFGNTEGGVTSISIKSGTNAVHGSAYYFAEPVKWAANDFFGNARGQARPDSFSNRPGFSIHGPVRIPKLYDGRDKTFFLFGVERIREGRPRFDAGANVWVPTAKLRNGDFSDYSSNITIYDPATRVATGNGQFVGQPFPGNIIPQNRISPVARAILGFYADPKNPGLLGNIFDSTLPETTAYDTYTVRLDHNVSSNNRVFLRGSWYDRDSHSVDYFGTEATGTSFQFISRQGVIDDVHTFNSTTLLNVRYGYNRFIRNSGQEEDATRWDLTRLGFPAALNGMVPEADRRFPRLDFPGGTMIGTGQGGDLRPTTSHTVSATVNKSMSSHAVKLGSEMRIYREDSTPTGNDRSGQYVFNNTYTRQNSASGADFNGLQAYASFLLGLPSTTQIARSADYSEYSKTYGFFVHDDWRVNNKLTLNLGLRYEVETPLVERNDKSISGFDVGYIQPIQGTVQARYAALNDPALKALVPQLGVTGGLMFAGVDGGSGLYKTPKSSFLPRFGLTYKLGDRTVLRGGVGLFAGFLGQRRGDVIQPGFGRTTVVGTTTNANGAPIPVDIATAIVNTPILEPVGSALGRQTGLGGNISFFNQDPEVSKQLRWQIGVQRELWGGWVGEAVYVGNHGYNIEITRNINALPTRYLNTDNSLTPAMIANNAFLTAQVANPFAGLLPGTGSNNPTISRSQLLRPFPAYGDINTTNNDGKSWYQSGQFSLQKRFSQGYTLQAAYTWSRWEQATEYLNPADAKPARMVSDQDAPHRLSLSGIFELPFGNNRRFLSGASGITNAVLGGWQVQGVYSHQIGFPVPFGAVNATSGIVSNDAFYQGGDISIPSGQRTTDRWFETGVFTSVRSGSAASATPINHLRTLPIRFDNVRRDSINNVDLSLLKDVLLRGRVQLQLRAELINAFNSPYFPNPVTSPTSPTFGSISASNQENYARRAQLGVKVLF